MPSEAPRPIINTVDQLKAAGGGVAIVRTLSQGRHPHVCGWSVCRMVRGKFVATDPKASWYHNGQKVFYNLGHEGTFHERQQAVFREAVAWVAEQGWYTGDWKRNAVKDYVPADIQRRFPIRRQADGK